MNFFPQALPRDPPQASQRLPPAPENLQETGKSLKNYTKALEIQM
jgi:hypothetical protein